MNLSPKSLAKGALAELGLFGVYRCPVCGSAGRFSTRNGRPHACCWQCGSLERHRLQRWALDQVLDEFDSQSKTALQIAPDAMTPFLRSRFGTLRTADLFREADLKLDLRSIDLPDDSVDFLFASHVLEHIKEDDLAISEVHRILKPGGMAVMPVPVTSEKTIEYPHPVEAEHGHVRAPGPDYFDRFRKVFSRVDVLSSTDCPAKYQTYAYGDWTRFPTADMPFRQPVSGERHVEYVPICHA